MTTPSLMIPTIHLNGTSRESLTEGYEKAVEAMAAAIAAVGGTSPNARDFYPQGSDAFNQAAVQHQARMVRLREVEQELQQLHEAVALA